ncbi:DSBA-like thioredoxin domain protein [compost metagenome]
MTLLNIQMTFDVICPWCLIGKRNLETALRWLKPSHPEVDTRVAWKGLQLLPDLPAQGMPFDEFYGRRLGSKEAIRARQARVQAAAEQAGVEIDYPRIRTMPNTGDAHRLLARAAGLGSAEQADALLERLFAGYFQQGEDIGQVPVLLRLAESCGYDPMDFADDLHGDGRPYAGTDLTLASVGVPAIVIEGELSTVGAQPPELILAALYRAVRQRTAPMELSA